MTSLVASRSQRAAAAVVFAALGAIGFAPLFGGPGYEHSLASGLIVPSAAAIATALDVSASSAAPPAACVGRGIASGLALAGVAFATALLHGLRVGICDLWGGATLFVLTAGCGAVVGGAWGAIAGEIARGRRRRRLACVALALAAPLAGVAISVWRFYASPMVFAYDPFFGYFSGALYDTVIDVRTELWTYRVGSLATITGLYLAASALTRTPAGGLAPRRDRVVAGIAGIAALAAAVAVSVEGPALGHWQTSSTIAAALGGRASGLRCDLIYPDGVLAPQVRRMVRDCEEELAADEARLGAHLDGRLTELVFADADQKRRLMGAAETSIAKPWRREVYVQLAGYPHPVLGHEIAHVVAGSFARRPFRVGGGLLPDPGLIEGVAEAASPGDDELTEPQWARAMLDQGILPAMSDVFSLGFLGKSAAESYTVAGAFVSWIIDRWGTAVLRAWYGGGSIEVLTRRSWADLEAGFRQWLLTLPMPPQASAYARAKFERPSVWARRCPHVVDALDRAADRCLAEHRFEKAAALYSEVLARDPNRWHARFDHAIAARREGAEHRARAELEALAADPKTPRTWRDRVDEALADDDVARGLDARAADEYRAIAERSVDEDAVRTLEVKELAARDPSARRALLDLFVEEPGHAQDSWLGALSLGEWSARPGGALPEYLVGKNLAVRAAGAPRDEWERAADWLDRALHAGPPTGSIGRELLRQRAICACVLDDAGAEARVAADVTAPASPFAGTAGGRRDWILRLLDRCKAPAAGRAP